MQGLSLKLSNPACIVHLFLPLETLRHIACLVLVFIGFYTRSIYVSNVHLDNVTYSAGAKAVHVKIHIVFVSPNIEVDYLTRVASPHER